MTVALLKINSALDDVRMMEIIVNFQNMPRASSQFNKLLDHLPSKSNPLKIVDELPDPFLEAWKAGHTALKPVLTCCSRQAP